MYQPASNACNGPNGSKPLPAALVARMQAQRKGINAAANNAETAVLGYCTNPASYNLGVNIQNEVASSPGITAIVRALTGANVGQLVAGTGATGNTGTSTATLAGGPSGKGAAPPARACWDDSPATVVPLSGTIPVQPPVLSLSLLDAGNAGIGLGDYPLWGDSFSGAGGPAAALANVTDWFSANPGVTVAGILLAAALLFGKK